MKRRLLEISLFSYLVFITVYTSIDSIRSSKIFFADMGVQIFNALIYQMYTVDVRVPRYSDYIYQFLPMTYIKYFETKNLEVFNFLHSLSRFLFAPLPFLFMIAWSLWKKNFESITLLLLGFSGFYLIMSTSPGSYAHGTMIFVMLSIFMYLHEYHLKLPILTSVFILLSGLGHQAWFGIFICFIMAEIYVLKADQKFKTERVWFIFVNLIMLIYMLMYLLDPVTPSDEGRSTLHLNHQTWAYLISVIVILTGLCLYIRKSAIRGFIFLALIVLIFWAFYNQNSTGWGRDLWIGKKQRILFSLAMTLFAGIVLYLKNVRKIRMEYSLKNLLILSTATLCLSGLAVNYILHTNRTYAQMINRVQSTIVGKKGCIFLEDEVIKKIEIWEGTLPMVSILVQNTTEPEVILLGKNPNNMIAHHLNCSRFNRYGYNPENNLTKKPKTGYFDFSNLKEY